MAAGNCLPELSISLMSILANGPDIGTGEVLGSCVFDLLAMLGVVCIKLPKEGARIPLPLVLYFLAWVVIATTTDLLLFFTTAEITWRFASPTLTPTFTPTPTPTLTLTCVSSRHRGDHLARRKLTSP
jgi:Ca2+/Na+ antiporter